MKNIIILVASLLALTGCDEATYVCGDDGYLYQQNKSGTAAWAVYSDMGQHQQMRCIRPKKP